MVNLSKYIPELLRLVRVVYPDWTDFSNPQFVADEIKYKRDASDFAREQLDRDVLWSLIEQGDTDGFIARLKAVAGKTNLLFMGVPSAGDLALINQPDSDLDAICRMVFDLLHGDGDAAERLGTFCDLIAANKLPQKWTFPTYYLFLLYPENEVFVKPGRTQWLSRFTDGAIPYNAAPSGAGYAAIREGFHALRDALQSQMTSPQSQSWLPDAQLQLNISSTSSDMIAIQSFVYVAHKAAGESDVFEKAVEHLRAGLPALETIVDLADIESSREMVYGRYGHSFAPEQLPNLSAEEYLSFLRFENNHHWTGINRYGSRTVQDMSALRQALGILVDEQRPLAERYDLVTGGMVEGIGRATATPILHVAYPDRYGVWNTKVEAGLKELGIFPNRPPKMTDGQLYAEINKVLLELAAALDISLWTLDNLWEWMSRRRTLASPFDKIFADRAQAEHIFDRFADAVERLGGRPDDPRFALTLRKDGSRMRLIIGHSMVMDIADSGRVFNLTALKEPMAKGLSLQLRDTFSGKSEKFGIFRIPVELINEWPPQLQAIYEQSMAEFGIIFKVWKGSNFPSIHKSRLFEALFDEEKRDQLLTNGLTTDEIAIIEETENDDPPPPTIAKEFTGFTADAFAFMRELAANNNTVWMRANRERWRESVYEPMKALFTDLGPKVQETFDPYLVPDMLEIEPTTKRTLSNIYKNWAATEDSAYHHYYWGAFYRARLTRQADTQLFITMFAKEVRYGIFIGRGAPSIRQRFRERVKNNPEGFLRLVENMGLANLVQYGWSAESGERKTVAVDSKESLVKWVESEDFELLRVLIPEEVVSLGPALADSIYDIFRRIFPIYLWAVADDHEAAVMSYLEAEFPHDDGVEETDPPTTPNTHTDIKRDPPLTADRAEELWAMLKDKQQAIFSGPPGTGKTYVARRLARLITGLAEPPPERLTVVQFHAAYGYEEFIEGIRPRSERGEDGRALIDYPVRPGAFVRFCRAAERIDGPCVFIIDEINRGNIPRIFGELMYLLEYRQKEDSIPLPYSGERFRIPPNVYVIGTMNTADRSIALVDFALRRRFHFAEFAADPALFDRWLADNPPAVPWLGALYRALAERGIDERTYAIGPSVFMRPGLDTEAIHNIWNWSVMPYLREYYIDRPGAVPLWEWDSHDMRAIRTRYSNGEPADGYND